MAAETQKLLGHLLRLTDQATSDAALLGRWVQAKDENAYATLLARHGPMVLGVCNRVLGDRQHAEDAFQATFLVLARKAATLKQPEALPGFLYGVALRLARKARATRRCRSVPAQSDAPEPADPQPHALNALSGRELLAMVDAEVARLPEVYRLPVLLCVLQERSVEEAARILDWSTGSVRGRLARGRQRLRQRLTDRGLASSGGALAPAKLPHQLLSAALRNLTSAAPPVVNVLAGTSMGLGIKALCIACMLIPVGLGVGLPLLKAPEAPSPLATALPVPIKKEPQHVDLLGDPLPEGVIARLGSRRFRHEGETYALIFTPDGKSLVDLCGWPGHREAIHLWEASTGRELPRLPIDPPGFPHIGGFTGLAVSPDGSTLAIPESSNFESDTRVALWSLKTGKKTQTLSLQPGQTKHAQFHTLSFSPDGKYLAVSYAGQGGGAVFALPSGKVQSYLGVPRKQTVYNFTPSPDSKMLAVAVNDNPPDSHGGPIRVQLCDIATGKWIRNLYELPDKGANSFIRSLAFSRDGKLLAFGITDRIVLCDPATGKTVRELTLKKMGQIIGIAFAPDGKRLVSAGEQDGKVSVWDVASGKRLRVLGRRFDLGRGMALSPDGNTVALGTCNNAVQMWDVRSGKELFPEEPGHDSQVYDLVFLPDGKTLISTGLYQKTLLWDVAKHQVRGVLPVTAEMLQLSADGKLLAGHTDYAGEVRIWDTTERKEAVKLKTPKNFRVVTASFAATPGKLNTVEWHYKENKSGEPVVRQWDLATGKPDGMWPTPAPQDGLNPIVERGKKVYVALSKGGLSIYDIDSKSQRIVPTGEPVQLVRNPLSFDGRVLVTSLRMDAKAPIKLWEVLTGKEIWRLAGHEGFKHAVGWSVDGRLLASGDQLSVNGSGAAQTIRLWDTASGKQLACFGGIGSDVTALAFTPDSAVLAAGLRDSTILLYDVGKFDPRRVPPARLNEAALESLWNELASDQAGKAHQALWQLVDGARDSLPFLLRKMKPKDRVDAAAVQKWIADLDSAKFPVRQEAARQLEKCGGQIRGILEAALKGSQSLETRRRLQEILRVLELPGLDSMRTIRAIMVLERTGSSEARSLLDSLAAGTPTAHETEEARDSLRRLVQRAGQASLHKSP